MISKCDHQDKHPKHRNRNQTWHVERTPVIPTGWWSRVWVYPAKAQQDGLWMVFELNRTVCVVWTQSAGGWPGPVSNTMSTCTTLRLTLLEWQMNKGVHLKVSNSKLKADRPDRSNYFNYMNKSSSNASCCTATCRELLTSTCVADMYIFLMNTWNTLPESYQQRLYKYSLPTV